jgi:hypothetical protein
MLTQRKQRPASHRWEGVLKHGNCTLEACTKCNAAFTTDGVLIKQCEGVLCAWALDTVVQSDIVTWG